MRNSIFEVKTGNKKNTRKGERYHRVATVQEMDDYYQEWSPWWVKGLRVLLGMVLIFPCLAVTVMVMQQFHQDQGTLTQQLSSVCFLTGAGICLLIHLFPLGRKIFLPIYVFGHEVTHAIFVFCCYGKVSDFNADAKGGYIIANRSNLVVALSPYVFPFWCLVVALCFFLPSLFMDITPYLAFFYVLVGASWFFNLLWTVLMIPLGQSDLKDNGTFFSLTVIYLSNLLILSVLLELATPSPEFAGWFFHLLNTHLDLLQHLTGVTI